MKNIFECVKTTMIGGLVVILPITVVLLLFQRVFVAVHTALEPLAARLE